MARKLSAESEDGRLGRLRRAGLFALFALVLLIPKTLALRRQPSAWKAVRIGLGLLGAGLVLAPVGGWYGGLAAVAGLAMCVLAVLAPAAKQQTSVDEQARELAALVVLNGGWFRLPSGERVAARLFVASRSVYALDSKHRSLAEIPFSSVSSIRAEHIEGGWRLRIEGNAGRAEFCYEGFFAEHLAKVAENTLRSQHRHGLHVLR